MSGRPKAENSARNIEPIAPETPVKTPETRLYAQKLVFERLSTKPQPAQPSDPVTIPMSTPPRIELDERVGGRVFHHWSSSAINGIQKLRRRLASTGQVAQPLE